MNFFASLRFRACMLVMNTVCAAFSWNASQVAVAPLLRACWLIVRMGFVLSLFVLIWTDVIDPDGFIARFRRWRARHQAANTLLPPQSGTSLSAPDASASSAASAAASVPASTWAKLSPAAARERAAAMEKAVLETSAKVYASLLDAVQHGWAFERPVGQFEEAPIYQYAIANGVRWEFDGLAPSLFNPVVPDAVRIFGRLRYRRLDGE